MTSEEFIKQYVDLLIMQYSTSPRALGDISAYADSFSKTALLYDAFKEELDLDFARGAQLDILGRIIVLSRSVPFIIPRVRFGFGEFPPFTGSNPNARGFSDLFDIDRPSAPFKELGEPDYTTLQLDDAQYRIFLKAKAAVNSASAYLISDDRISIQDVINILFEGEAWVSDNFNMSLTLTIAPSVDKQFIEIIKILDLLPRGMGVKYFITIADPTESFGFGVFPGLQGGNPNALGFSDLFDASRPGGHFAELLV